MTIAISLLLLLASPPAEVRTAAPEIDALELTEEMGAFLDDNVDRHLPEYDRLNQLVAAIFSDSLLGFQYDRSRTKTAAETFQEASGNCLSFSSLLVAMGRRVGLEAHFQEVDTPPTWDRHGKVVVAARHVNVVVFIGARVYEVDLAPQVARVRMGARVIGDDRGRAHFYSNRGVDFFGKGSPATAMQYFRRALAEDDKVPFAWANLGAVQSLMGQYEKAEKSYLKAIRLDTSQLSAMDNLVNLYEKMGRDSDAKKYRKKIARYRNKNPFYHFSLGQSAFDSGDFAESVKHYRDAIKRRSNDHRFYFQLALAYARLQDYERVRESLANAHKYSPDEFNENRYSRKLELLASRH